MRIAVLGAGAWGTVLGAIQDAAGHAVTLWARSEAAAAEIEAQRENRRYLPGRALPPSLVVTADIGRAVRGAEMIVLAVPSAAARPTLALARPHVAAAGAGAVVVTCASKGLDPDTRRTMDGVIADELPGAQVALLSGPSFALEIARGLPAALVAASRAPATAAVVQACFSTERFRVYTSEDVTGVAIGGALKNVVAIAVGCSDGLGFGNNARAALITRGLNELGRLATRLGGDPLTLAGLAGLGDLVLTCTGELSRNRQVGLALARGEALPAILGRLDHVAEGIGTARIARDLAAELGIDMPITSLVAAVLHEGKPPRQGVAELLARESKAERG
jgi:glycerol-3-phosphate dehydrogenase (NAD(P)+)